MASATEARGNNGSMTSAASTPEEDVRTVLIHRVSWSAVFAGVAMSLVAQLLLNMVGVAFGAGAIDPATPGNTPSASSFSVGAGLWWAISGILASALGGYAAGRLSGRPEPSTTAWHGLTAWAFTTLALFYLLTTTIGSVVGGAVSAVGSAANTAAQSGMVQSMAPALLKGADPFTAIDQQARAASGDQNAQRDALVAALRDLMTGNQAQQAEARERAVQALARVQNVPPEQARGQVANWEQQYRSAVDQAKQTATRAADTASRTVSWSMVSAVIALLLGAWVAWLAGREAAVSPTITDVARRLRPPSRTTVT